MAIKPWLLHPHLRRPSYWRSKADYEQLEACAAAARLIPYPETWKPGFDPATAGTSVVGDRKFPAWRRASVLHDHDYTRPFTTTKRAADDLFLARLLLIIPHEPRAWKRRQMRIAYWWRKAAIRGLSWVAWHS
jgi:hypothetical protein